ncbi:MAG: NAD(P)H-hydrate epimerase [Phycisphaerales bacterium]|nr:MAG: NAD(P)H-hydrate epimerase [Phycisphaerales bacterium]
MSAILTRDQVRQVDHIAVNRYAIAGVVLMENAGRNASRIINRTYGPEGNVFICCGPGNNGGDGCVIARHLHNLGWSVRGLITGAESQMTPDMLANYRIVKAMGLPLIIASSGEEQLRAVGEMRNDDVVADALLGTGFRGQVRSPTAELIEAINDAHKRATVAIDLPSGLDCDTGEPSNATIRADLTVTFVAKKMGFTLPASVPFAGKVEVADIGAPRGVIEEILASSAQHRSV